jgi:hypothetical protein
MNMLKQFAKIAASFSLMLTVSLAAPAWSAGKSNSQANCPYAKAKPEKAKRSMAAVPTRSLMIVETRKRDVQILSFGP